METQVHRGGASPGERPAPLLRLYLLGRFEVVRDDAPIPAQAWRRRRPADLLRLVALSPGRIIGREEAIDVLWPDKDPASGANNLHRALYDLRQILGGRFVDLDEGQLRMRPDVWIDVDAFERAAAEGTRESFAQAVSLYRGDLAPDEPECDWLRARRQVLRGRFAGAAFPLARAAAQDGELHLAIPLLRRILETDPAQEDAHRALMRLLAESGRRAEALRQYDACDAALRAAELGPSEETRALRTAIQRGEVGPGAVRPALDGARRASRRLLGTTDPLPIRGRGPLVLLLESLVEQGSGAIVLLGEAGVGKTRLAVEAARLAQGRGAAVVCGIAGAHGAPYALLADALREEERTSPGLADPFAVPPSPGVAGEETRRALFGAVERALLAAADGRPLCLVLDDIHLADESSLNLVHFLARRAPALRLMIVATCGEEAIHAGTPIQTALTHLDCGRLARGVRVPRLGLAGTREQVADLLGAPAPEGVVAQIHAATDGSPLLVEEVVLARTDPGRLVPADPDAAIRSRVARLGPFPGALLAAAAVAGPRFEIEPVRAVSGLTLHDASAALDACLEARILDEDGSGCHFHHPIVRDAVYRAIEPGRRAVLHSALADALEAAAGEGEAPSEAIAHHRRRAGQDARAYRHLVAAGHRAAARAGLREALAFYSEALDLSRGPAAADPLARLELLDAVGRVQLGLGELAGASGAFAEAARLVGASGARPEPPLRARAHRLAALALACGGHLRAAGAEIAEGIAAAAGSEGLAPLFHLRAQILWHAGSAAEALAAAEACAAEAGRSGDDDLVARGHDLAALARALAGEPLGRPADRTSDAERRRQDAAPDHPVDLDLVLWDRDLAADGGCTEVARAASLLAERARMRGDAGAAAAGRFGEGAAALGAGDLDVAEAALRGALEGHRAASSALGEALALERLAALLTARGRLDEALAAVDEGIVVAERAALRRHALVRLHATEARNRLAAGALQAAEDAVREASEAGARHGDCVACDAAFRPEAVRVLLARGRISEADTEASQLEEIARADGGRVLGAAALLARARVLAAQGRIGEALAAASAARAPLLAAGQRLEAARCARFESRLRGPASPLPGEVRALEGLVVLDTDA